MTTPTILAVSDVVDDRVWSSAPSLGADLVVSCGDLPNDYLEYLVLATGAPLVYVAGNHDSRQSPRGCVSVDGRVETVLGLRVGGLGGAPRYRPGPHQYTERQMARRARRLVRAAKGKLDVFVTHAAPAGVGDDPTDNVHRGFAAFLTVLDACHPRLMVHGHVQTYGPHPGARRWDGTPIVNAIPHRVLTLPPRVTA